MRMSAIPFTGRRGVYARTERNGMRDGTTGLLA